MLIRNYSPSSTLTLSRLLNDITTVYKIHADLEYTWEIVTTWLKESYDLPITPELCQTIKDLPFPSDMDENTQLASLWDTCIYIILTELEEIIKSNQDPTFTLNSLDSLSEDTVPLPKPMHVGTPCLEVNTGTCYARTEKRRKFKDTSLFKKVKNSLPAEVTDEYEYSLSVSSSTIALSLFEKGSTTPITFSSHIYISGVVTDFIRTLLPYYNNYITTCSTHTLSIKKYPSHLKSLTKFSSLIEDIMLDNGFAKH